MGVACGLRDPASRELAMVLPLLLWPASPLFRLRPDATFPQRLPVLSDGEFLGGFLEAALGAPPRPWRRGLFIPVSPEPMSTCDATGSGGHLQCILGVFFFVPSFCARVQHGIARTCEHFQEARSGCSGSRWLLGGKRCGRGTRISGGARTVSRAASEGELSVCAPPARG